MKSTVRVISATGALSLLIAPLAAVAAPHATQTSTLFAGYAVGKPSKVTSATATFRVPTITCRKKSSGVGPAVVLISATSKKTNTFTYSGAGVAVACIGGAPVYEALVIVNGTATQGFTLKAGDKVRVVAKEKKPKATISLADLSSGAHLTKSGKGRAMSTGEVGVESLSQNNVNLALDPFTKTSFTDAAVNGRSLAKEKAFVIVRKDGKTTQIKPSKLSKGENFTATFKHD